MRKRGKQACDSNVDMVSAHEIACFVYCPEQWRLQYGLQLTPENQESLASGRRFHAHTSLADMIASWAIRLGVLLVGAAFLLLLVVVWLRWR